MRHYLKEYQDRLGYTTYRLAEITKIDRVQLVRIRQNPEYRISAVTAMTLASALGITVEQLYQAPGGDA